MKTIKVVAAIIHENGRILIGKRSYGEFKGLYEFPGGKVEPGETGEQAIRREIMEEMDVHIAVEKFFTNVQYDYPHFHLDMDCYLCHLIDHHMVLDSHSEIQWIRHDDPSLKWCPADKLVISEIIKRGLNDEGTA